MKTISEVYKEYKIMSNLQEHMLRVASVASQICDSLDIEVDKESILTACLLHDMGNILKFELGYFPKFLEPEGLQYWQKVKDEYENKYGKDEHVATIKIVQELNVPQRILDLINAISFLGAPDVAAGSDFGKKIVEYCDDRVNPFGVVSLKGRLMDLRKRHAHYGDSTPELKAFENAAKQMEDQIFSNCKIKPEDITDESIAPIMEELKGFVIK